MSERKPSRMTKLRADLRKRGGLPKTINMEAGDLANLAKLRECHQLKSDSDAVSWALQVALQVKA